MSNRHLLSRALGTRAPLVVALSPLLACASGGGRTSAPRPSAAPDRSASDTSSIANGQGKTMENLFEGRFSGVSVVRTASGGLQIRIRGGSNSFYSGEEPLYVVDDTPLPPGSDGILFLNPYDIQKIEVLKNPADIAIYGIRGANGVVKVTTKKSRGP